MVSFKNLTTKQMDSLDAIRRWTEKRDKVLAKLSSDQKKIAMPERVKISQRLRPGEISAKDFATWMGALNPNTGAVNEFRTKMFQSDMRGLQNRIQTNLVPSHPGWALWGYDPIPEPVRSMPTIRQMVQLNTKPPRREAPGIEPFFINTLDRSPLPGTSLHGGALTQLPRSNRAYRQVEDQVIKNARAQAAQLTAMRKGIPEAPPKQEALTALDEAKLSIGATLESVGQQIMRSVYSADTLRDLTQVSILLARNAPIMEPQHLELIFKYVSDLAAVMRSNAKNTGKEIAEDNLLEFAEEPEFYGDTWRSFIGGPKEATQADARDLDKGVEKSAKLAEVIFGRLEAISEFVRQQFAVAERPIGERIQVARSALPLLGANIDRKKYPADVKLRLEREEKEQAAKQAAEVVQEAVPGGMPILDVQEMPPAMPMAPVMLPPPQGQDAFAELMAERAAAQEQAARAAQEQAAAVQATNEERARVINELVAQANTAAIDENFVAERTLLLQAYGLAQEMGVQKTMDDIAEIHDDRIPAWRESGQFPAGTFPAAPAGAAGEEEEAAAAGEEEAAAGVDVPEKREVDAVAYELKPAELMQFLDRASAEAKVATPTASTTVSRTGNAMQYLNSILTKQDIRRISAGAGQISLGDVIKQLSKENRKVGYTGRDGELRLIGNIPPGDIFG